MKLLSALYNHQIFTNEVDEDFLNYQQAQLVLGFGSRELVSQEKTFEDVRNKFPNAAIALCSSAGEIYNTEVYDDTLSMVAIEFKSTTIETCEINCTDYESSFKAGVALVEKTPKKNLKLLFVLSDGGLVNGSELVKGMNSVKGKEVLITGGLAGDGARFEKTVVGLNKVPESGKIIAIGFYGDKIELSHSSLGGWDPFGLERTITKSKNNVLYGIDNKSALSFYKNYLGKYADELPGAALLFPLSIILKEGEQPIVRTILSIDEEKESMTFAGDVPLGSKIRFMKANFDRLIDAASVAATNCLETNKFSPKLALLISCVGRKLILNNRIDEEIEAVADIFGSHTMLCGFYSYGEISPLNDSFHCELHNQTMTITCINELE